MYIGKLGGGNSNIFYFHPENWGRWTQFDEHIFQMGGKKPPPSKSTYVQLSHAVMMWWLRAIGSANGPRKPGMCSKSKGRIAPLRPLPARASSLGACRLLEAPAHCHDFQWTFSLKKKRTPHFEWWKKKPGGFVALGDLLGMKQLLYPQLIFRRS